MTNNRTSTSIVCFIVCDAGPATHFAAFASNLIVETNFQIDIYASGPALAKLKDLHLTKDIQLHPFTINDISLEQQEQLAKELIDHCLKQKTQTIITDIGNPFDAILQTFSSNSVRVCCYYDNPEPYVPGGYSIKTAATIRSANHLLFANWNLAKVDSSIYSSPETKIDLSNKTMDGIGYYPVEDVEKLKQQRRIARDILRAENGWTNIKYLFVYFGGNNDVYFNQALPTFLSCLAQLDDRSFSDILFLFHQHPGAKLHNRDGRFLQDWRSKNSHVQIQLSTLKSSDQAQIVADAALYYQTSMAPQFILLGLPTLQIGHEIYQDILVQFHLCSTATNASELAIGLEDMRGRNQSIVDNTQLIYDAIGYTPDWPTNLRHVVFH